MSLCLMKPYGMCMCGWVSCEVLFRENRWSKSMISGSQGWQKQSVGILLACFFAASSDLAVSLFL